ncbi:MAG: DJ-1 family protein [Candidatus Methanogaster sp.]|uniref:DJ-1 family protein n=1 Tax=Candidatus Methanogaster sp. TaxID=3386292 RepID=A0AC61L3U6_9EURY|nr:MAG: DJ-1 family protein [ANME-2 cluster archaeon]
MMIMRYGIVVACLMLCISVSASGCITEDNDTNDINDSKVHKMIDMSNKTILMVIAPSDFRDEELFIPKEFFEKNGAEVVIASEKKGTAKGMLGGTAPVDLPVSEVAVSDYDAVVFVGGSGVESHKLYENEAYLKLAADAENSEKIIGAICLGPMVPAAAGILSGKNATVFESGTSYITGKGARYTGAEVTRDGRIITGECPHAAEEFARTVSKALTPG